MDLLRPEALQGLSKRQVLSEHHLQKRKPDKGVLLVGLHVLHQHQYGLWVATMVDDLNNRNSFSQNGSPETQIKVLQSQTPFKCPTPAPSLPLPASGHPQLSVHLQLASFLCLLCLSHHASYSPMKGLCLSGLGATPRLRCFHWRSLAYLYLQSLVPI